MDVKLRYNFNCFAEQDVITSRIRRHRDVVVEISSIKFGKTCRLVLKTRAVSKKFWECSCSVSVSCLNVRTLIYIQKVITLMQINCATGARSISRDRQEKDELARDICYLTFDWLKNLRI